MRVLVGCEHSGIIREAFASLGHDAWSCDLLPTEQPGNHIQDDIRKVVIQHKWDLAIFHPPCTYLARCGARWMNEERHQLQQEAIEFALFLWAAPIPKVCIENPVGVLRHHLGHAQIIHPWMFGHGETKKTALWIRGLPWLSPTNIVNGRSDRIHKVPERKDRWKIRSRTYPGIAEAMAQQWGGKVEISNH